MFRYVRAALAAAALFLIAPIMKANPAPDKDGHVLTALWKQYEEASKADRPQKEADILSKIKVEAVKQRLAADFYDAAVKYVETVQRRDWKKRDELRRNLEKEVKDFDEPMVTYLWMSDQAGRSSDARWVYVRDRAEAFRAGHNTALWRGIGGLMGGAMKDFVGSDYEYVLWHLLGARRYDHPEKDEIYQALKTEVEGKSPQEGYLAYYVANRTNGKDARKAALEEVARKYAGQAVAFWPRQELLRIRFGELNDQKAGSAAYQALYADCLAYEKERKAQKGDDAKVVAGINAVKNLTETLTGKGVGVRLEDKDVCVTFRNLDKATLTLREGDKTVKTWNLTNPTRSFYVYDTVRVALPTLGDGAYTLEAVNGKLSGNAYYSQHTLSLAVRREADGFAAYVTDYISGKPLDKAKLVLWKGDKEVASEQVRLDGFTVLPKKFQDTIDGHKETYYYLTAETGSGTALRASRKVGAHAYYYYDDDDDRTDRTFCHIYKDRGAYNPGDVLQFKAVVYKGNLVDRVSVVPDKAVEVILLNSEDKEIDRLKLKTNEFGSISGSFTLPKGERNGYFQLQVKSGKQFLEGDSFRVDEFVLPTFTLSFDKNDQLYLRGDEVVIKGKVKSFSGHSLTGADLAVHVERWGNVVLETTVQPASDGTFSFSFPAKDTGWYNADVTVTDATGEMQEFATGVYVSDNITVSLTMQNGAEGEFVTMDEKDEGSRYIGRRWRPSAPKYIATGEVARVLMEVDNSDGNKIDVPVQYELLSENGTVVLSGKAASGEVVEMDLKGLPDGLYSLVGKASERDAKDESKCWILKVDPKGKVLDAPVRRLFLTGPEDVPMGEKIRLTMGTADGAEYAVVTLFGKARKVLETRKVVLQGVRAKAGSLTTLEFDYKAEYPDAVRLQVFYFKRGEAITFDKEYSRTRTRLALPLKFESFTDKAFPGTSYTFTLKTDPGVEALVAVYDKSIDAIAGNHWPVVTLREFSVPYVNIESVCGRVSGDNPFDDELVLEETVVAGYGAMKATRSAVNGAMEDRMVLAEAPMMMKQSATADEAVEAEAGAPEVTVRSKFENALTFQPHLVSDAAGNLSFTFNTSDKLSTYYVALYAHDKGMRNTYLREEMVVSVPVKVAVVEPQFLYVGDTYEVAASVSSNTDKPVSGWLYLYTYPSKEYEGVEPIGVQRVSMTVPAGGTESHRFPVRVPAVETLGFKVVFAADGRVLRRRLPPGSGPETRPDPHRGPFRRPPGRHEPGDAPGGAPRPLRQCACLRGRIDRNHPPGPRPRRHPRQGGSGRQGRPLPLRGLLLPGSTGNLAEGAGELLEKVLACRNNDGGFGWFEGMESSPVITAVLLQRFARLRDRGFEVPDLTSSVKFLDTRHFATELPYWRGYLSDAQYLFVRSLYPTVPFEVKPVTKEAKKRFEEFQKYVKGYLVPSAKDGRGLQGQIMAKARRVQTLLNLSASSEGIALAKAWGVKVAAKSKMESSLKADIASLKEYAVEHRDGGWYYPNAVMPWRGLLETEADAHALLCGLMDPYAPEISDGIRLWLMLQKETQKWDESPAFVEAITAILDGSDAVLATSILSYSATYDKPFAEIKAAGNGFTIVRKFFREKTVERVYDDRSGENDKVTAREEIAPGTPVAVGDKIIAEYHIWNQENRSFVKVDAFREAALRPVQQLSGHTGWGWFSLRRLTFTPQGYRNVKADRTEYYFDSFPEENTTLTEEFFVTQAGTFTAPVITVESLYAPRTTAPTTPSTASWPWNSV